MEAGTLNFDDLMDTGDFPGFEIAKFTPAADDKDDNDRDGILRTPEHVREDDDFVVQPSKPTLEKVVTENGDCNDIQNVENGMEDLPGVDIENDKEKVEENSADDATDIKEDEENDKPHNGGDIQDVSINPTKGGDGDKDVVVNGDESEKIDFVVEINQEEDYVVELNKDDDEEEEVGEDNSVKEVEEDEPVPKRKKMSLMPASKPKMKLWGGNKKTEDTGSTPDKDTGQSAEGDADNATPTVDRQNDKAEEDPHQQSFLSFLNLQPGSSKTADKSKDNNKQEKTKAADFYSRKRLRTRKKVSYVEDVAVDIDDEYQDDEEEQPYDHVLSVPHRRRSSGSGGRQNSFNNTGASAVMKYTEAMKKLNMPASQLVPHNSTPSFSNMPNSSRPGQVTPTQQSTTQLYRNILPKGNAELVEPKSNGPMKGLFECGLCGTFFSTAGQFISHQEKAHNANKQKGGRSGIETFRCEVCQFVLTNRFAYLEHKRMKHSKNQITFNCNKCGSSFSYLIDLQKHKQICGLPYTYTCTHCNLQMRDHEEMAAHNAKFHPPQTPAATPSLKGNNSTIPSVAVVNTAPTINARQWVACAIRHCTFKCLTQMEMKHHVQNKHNPQFRNSKGDLFPCNAPKCSKIFPTREKLMEHKRDVHASEFIVQYQCMECKSCYSTKTLLAEHQYLHMMDKMKKCDICMRRFSSHGQLMKHKEVHTNKGIYKCTSCSRWCKDKEELALHVCCEKKKNLVGLRVYFCDICHRDFRTDEQMFRHRKDHKNYYQCITCRWDGEDEEEYFKHRESHGVFTCRECCEEIPTEAELSTHRKAHKFYVKMEEIEEEDGNAVPVMYLCPSLMNAVQNETVTA